MAWSAGLTSSLSTFCKGIIECEHRFYAFVPLMQAPLSRGGHRATLSSTKYHGASPSGLRQALVRAWYMPSTAQLEVRSRW